MAYYYVKNGGTATGDGGRYTTMKTGSWSTAFSATSEYYNAINFSPTTALVAGDVILWSDESVRTSGSNLSYIGPSTGLHRVVITVDNENVDQYSPDSSPQIQVNSSRDLTFTGKWMIYGGNFYATRTWYGGAESSCRFIDCTIKAGSTGTGLQMSGEDSATAEYHNCTFEFTANGDMYLNNGALLRMIGCSITGLTTGGLVGCYGGRGGASFYAEGCDFSTHTGVVLLDGGTSSTSDRNCIVEFKDCKMGNFSAWSSNDMHNMAHLIKATGSGTTSAQAEYQFYWSGPNGQAEEIDTIYRDNSKAWPSGAKTALKVTTNADCSLGNAFWFDF